MAETSNPVAIELLGRTFNLRCPSDQVETLKEAASHLDSKMRNIQQAGSVGYEKIAILAAMDVAYELMRMRHAKENNDEEVVERIKELQDKINHVIAESGVSLVRRSVGEQQTLAL